MRRRFAIVLGIWGLAVSSAWADATTYQHDALGRLLAPAVSGVPGGAPSITTDQDPAGNRKEYRVEGGSTATTNRNQTALRAHPGR